jgi:hypothetical protein
MFILGAIVKEDGPRDSRHQNNRTCWQNMLRKTSRIDHFFHLMQKWIFFSLHSCYKMHILSVQNIVYRAHGRLNNRRAPPVKISQWRMQIFFESRLRQRAFIRVRKAATHPHGNKAQFIWP